MLATCIGGLQDQMGFKKEDGSYLKVTDYTTEWPTNSDGKYKNHGEWAFPVWPVHTLQGSPQTPYIYDSIPSIKDIGSRIKEAYNLGTDELKRRGKLGRDFVLSDDSMMTAKHMGDNTIKSIENLFDNWKPRKRFSVIDLMNEPEAEYPSGLILNSEVI